MAVTVDWLTFVITIPQADLTDLGGGVYELDVDWFRLQLKAIEESVDGMPFTDTHVHNTEIILSGVTYARFVEIISPYTVEFEDGQYTVIAKGANHNIADVKVANQVSLITQNSAGLIVVNTGGVISPSQQEIRDSMKLAPSAGTPATDSIDRKIQDSHTAVALAVAFAEETNDLEIKTWLRRGLTNITSPVGVTVTWRNTDGTVLFTLTEANATSGQDPDAQGVYAFTTNQALGDDLAYYVDVTITDSTGPVAERHPVSTIKGG